jgi:putative ABC transport system permease protein
VALSRTLPLSTRGDDDEFAVDVSQANDEEQPRLVTASSRSVSPGYFRAIGIPLLAGRDFTASDNEQHPVVAIVNERLAQRNWPAGSAVGKEIRFSPQQKATIIAVVGNVRQKALDQESVNEVYCSFYQTNSPFVNLLIRGSRPPGSIAPEISWIVHDLDPEAVITDVKALTQVREDSLVPRRSTALFFSIFACLALAITASGISGLMALEVSERRHEIGIRLALGATPGKLMSAMLGRLLAIIAVGMGCGFLVSWLMSGSMSKLVYGILPRDFATFAASSVLLTLVAGASSFIPLTRITKLDPTMLLRAER